MQKTIIVTGASDGIGAAAARKLAQQGERLLLVGRSREKLATVAEQLKVESFAADFERLADVRALATWIQGRTDRFPTRAARWAG